LVASFFVVAPVPSASACNVDISDPQDPRYSENCKDPDHWLNETTLRVGSGGLSDAVLDQVPADDACEEADVCHEVGAETNSSIQAHPHTPDALDDGVVVEVEAKGLVDTTIVVSADDGGAEAGLALRPVGDATTDAGPGETLLDSHLDVAYADAFEASVPAR
jgi:hypothetical protein